MRWLAPDRGHPARARDRPCPRDAAADPRRDGGRGRRLADRGGRPHRPVGSRRQGPRDVRALARGARVVIGRQRRAAPTRAAPARTRPRAPSGSRAAFAAAHARRAGPPSSRTSSPATRTRRRATGPPSPRSTRAPTSSSSACRTPTRWPTARRSSGHRGVALRNGATLEGSLALIERIAAARPSIPLVPMGYANQFIGGGDGTGIGRTTCRGRAPRA